MMRILLVDDEPRVIEALELGLGRRFDVLTASGGKAALELLRQHQDVAVILSDLRMPGMTGVELLELSRDVVPNAVRMLLTGNADLEAALAAVNRGFIFRFLLKPCPPEVLDRAFDDALEQYRLATADRDLLAQKVAEISGQLVRAEQLATLGTLAAAVGHELNNITAVFGSLVEAIEDSVAEQQTPEASDLQELGRVREHLEAHARQLLKLGRPDQDPPERLDLREVVRQTAAMLKLSGKTKLATVDLRLGLVEAPVLMRRTHLEQIFLNLIGNAADATGEVKGRRAQIGLEVEVDPAVGQVRCAITDNGCGIAADKLDTIFEPFFTTKPPGKGTGLGLPVVRQILAQASGNVGVTSRVGEGSVFTVTLPLASG